MPFKQGKSFTDVNNGLDKLAIKVSKKAGTAIFAAATVGAGISKTMTPIDTSTLVNSQYVKTEKTSKGWRAEIGYTANYAAAVHEKKGTLFGQERANGNGYYWEPRGMTRFLQRAFEPPYKSQVDDAFYRALKI